MKTKFHKTILFVFAVMSLNDVYAQDVDSLLFTRDVNGVRIGTEMSREQIINIFGTPDEYICHDDGTDGKGEAYYYGKTRIHFTDNIFDEFYVCDTTFNVLTIQIKGGLKVGDSISVLDNFKYGKPKKKKEGYYRLFVDSDNPIHLIVENGIIKGFVYSEPF